MKGFESFLTSHIHELVKIKGFETTQFKISDTKEFGEGEHKIMKEIRKLPSDKRHTVAIYGLDADLIILGLTITHKHSVFLFRENVHCALKEFDREDYVLMNVNLLW